MNIAFLLLALYIFKLTKIIFKQDKKIIKLAEEMAVLKENK